MKVFIAGVVIETAKLIPQDAVNVFRAVIDVDIFEQSFSENTHAAWRCE